MLEQVLERIADTLETISKLQEKDLAVHGEVAGLYRELLRAKGADVDSVSSVGTDAADAAPVAEVDDRKAREEEYERLKAELTKRGVEILPRTKLTTLQKLWEQHKDTPVGGVAADAGVIEPELPGMPPAPVETEEAEAVTADPFDIPAACVDSPDETRDYAKMSADDARALIMANYDSSESDKSLLVAALASVKAQNWLVVPEGKHGEVAKAYLASKGVKL
jgi:hypothetical protein